MITVKIYTTLKLAATLISRDREIALLERLYTTPLTASDFILGYALPFLPLAAALYVICCLAAFLFGLKFTVSVIFYVLLILPVSVFFISLGLLCSSALNVKRVGGICGAAIQMTGAESFTVTDNVILDVAVNALHIYNGCRAKSITIKNNIISAAYLCRNEADYDMNKVISAGNTISIVNEGNCVNKTEVIDSSFTLE